MSDHLFRVYWAFLLLTAIANTSITDSRGDLMTCQEYAEQNENEIDDYMQDAHWDGGLNTDCLFDSLIEWAKKDKINLTDIGIFDYDKYFWNIWMSMERGLS